MKTKSLIYFIVGLALILTGCSCENNDVQESDIQATTLKAGATQINGIGYYAEETDCDYTAAGADFALGMSGDLEGCLYVFVEDYGCTPSGIYLESGTEIFTGYYKGEYGTFVTTYKFEAKYEGCSEDGFFLGAEIFGRCQHPVVKGSGTGVFEGVTGRINFVDDVVTMEFPYKGHLKY
ncbi:hypothetical protein [Allomuricauda sp. NBRC 101325]|uniref:hypothetical protein n=1 Tax=Allomuricauda sp. NBRC 101325 TaxID=1113758 RepID=UPI00249FE143|nr:hypothetical protein [Muricauda sp. NBRC 101325]GLU44027.1 hypothetical protein Musp01_16510 [Muricauda sp. NBRC 101325]